ncbi:hypothetical protein RND81_06G102200, partial [Saponaria officinalis]
SLLEIFERTHKKKDRTYVKDTQTENFLVNTSYITCFSLLPSTSKHRLQIEDEVFKKLMYGEEAPKRPLGYGYGVKQSDVSGVREILRKDGFGCGEDNTLAFEQLKKALVDVTNENKELVKKLEDLQTKYEEGNLLSQKMTTQFGQILDIFSTGKAPTEFLNVAKSVLNMANTQ